MVVNFWMTTNRKHHSKSEFVACGNIPFSSLFAAGDVSRGGTSPTQRQKFHTDYANQCLRNKSRSHGVPNTNLFNFACLLVDFGKVLCSSANELQQNSNASSREDYIPQILTVLLEILRVYIWPLWPFVFCLSFVNNGLNNVTTPSTNQLFWPDSGQILRHQCGISVAESQTFLRAKRPDRRRARRNGCFHRLVNSHCFKLHRSYTLSFRMRKEIAVLCLRTPF